MNRGCADRPLANEDVVEKFRDNAGMSLSARRVQEVRDAVLSLDRAGDARAAIDRICQAMPQ